MKKYKSQENVPFLFYAVSKTVIKASVNKKKTNQKQNNKKQNTLQISAAQVKHNTFFILPHLYAPKMQQRLYNRGFKSIFIKSSTRGETC